MKKTSLIAYALALSLATPLAFAQEHRGPGPGDPRPGSNMDHQDWSRGHRLPPEYRRNDHVVNDWQSNHLRRPPRGYHWVRADDKFVLVAVTSGIIADIILNH